MKFQLLFYPCHKCFILSLLLVKQDEVLYEVNANSDNWMIAGRKRGHASLSMKQGSQYLLQLICFHQIISSFMSNKIKNNRIAYS